MLTYFHPDQLLHYPRTYLSRGRMRSPQEIPERAVRLLATCRSIGFEILEPADFGMAAIAAVHEANYLACLKTAHQEWKRMPADWGDEVMSNVYVYENNPLRGVLAQAARYLADGSCPIGADTWRSAYWSAQSAVAAADAIKGRCRQTYSLCRPPGHHARADRAGGFCYLNNAPIAAEALRRAHGRAPILDTAAEIYCMSPFTVIRQTSIPLSPDTGKSAVGGPASFLISIYRCRTVRLN